jgi:hypothetical protein
MTTEVGAGQSAYDIHAVADSAWLFKVGSETGAEPFLGDDGAVVIPVVSGSGPLLQDAPPDRTIKLPAVGAHHSRVAISVGASTLQRVVIDAHERLEEVSIGATGRIEDLTVNATRDDRALRVTGEADVGVLRLRGGSFALSPPLIRPTTVIDLRDTGVEIIGDTEGQPAQLLLSGHVQARSSWQVRSSHVEPGTMIETRTSSLRLGIVNKGEVSDTPVEMTLRSPGWVVCDYLPPASRVHLENGRLQLELPGPPSGASLEDKTVIRFFQRLLSVIEQLTVTGTGHVAVWWDLESPTFSQDSSDFPSGSTSWATS